MSSKKHAVVIGAGFSGLSTAAYLARDGYEVTVLEKNGQPGGRAFTLHQDGFRFELGPSWYMMPDIFEEFFADFNEKSENHYHIQKLDPSYRVFFSGNQHYDLSTPYKNAELFSQLEPGASVELERYLVKSEKLYTIARSKFLTQDYQSKLSLLAPQKLLDLIKLPWSTSYHSKVKQSFQDVRLQQILEFMTVFLGGSAKNIPALYGLLAHVDMNLGIWYPRGGFEELARSFEKFAKSQGAQINYKQEVTSIDIKDGVARGVRVGKKRIACDVVVGATDYAHVETNLLKENHRRYSNKYWSKRKLSPSALLISIGLNTKLQNLTHHNLFFDTKWDEHFKAIDRGEWTKEPLFYACVPSKTDSTSAPKGCENVFVLVPVAPGIEQDDDAIEEIKQNVYLRIGERAQIDVAKHIISEDVRAQKYFTEQFNAYKANAFGLAHTLMQSAFLRPSVRSKQVKNLFYAGQFTNPGTGVPLCVLSGKVVARAIGRSVYGKR